VASGARSSSHEGPGVRWWLTAIGVVAVAGFAALIATRTPRDRSQLWSEVGKGLIGLVIAGVLGTVLKLLAEAYQERRRLAQSPYQRSDKNEHHYDNQHPGEHPPTGLPEGAPLNVYAAGSRS
jgi:hypothetical protein